MVSEDFESHTARTTKQIFVGQHLLWSTVLRQQALVQLVLFAAAISLPMLHLGAPGTSDRPGTPLPLFDAIPQYLGDYLTDLAGKGSWDASRTRAVLVTVVGLGAIAAGLLVATVAALFLAVFEPPRPLPTVVTASVVLLLVGVLVTGVGQLMLVPNSYVDPHLGLGWLPAVGAGIWALISADSARRRC